MRHPVMELQPMLDTGNSKNKSLRRFNDDQIKSLETIFETESRPELQMKQQLANKLGLQPRQVAIWFQNKRARSKSKQIELDYTMLKFSYDNLSSRFESLKKENESLLIQLQRLQKQAEQGVKEDCANRDNIPENDDILNFLVYEHDGTTPYGGNSEKVNSLEEGTEVLNREHSVSDGSLTSDEKSCNFETTQFLQDSRLYQL